eukprot:TRINITY_DN8910_c0_g1_i3.p2 TRINITY_DN8910_c0_g1~~TRINITY_DN8910_c0_g1_i3.p2  ORF type:complete len:165 (-),score=72.16 TRINITY_DN8910_c0_g1_i3:11-505(-)
MLRLLTRTSGSMMTRTNPQMQKSLFGALLGQRTSLAEGSKMSFSTEEKKPEKKLLTTVEVERHLNNELQELTNRTNLVVEAMQGREEPEEPLTLDVKGFFRSAEFFFIIGMSFWLFNVLSIPREEKDFELDKEALESKIISLESQIEALSSQMAAKQQSASSSS